MYAPFVVLLIGGAWAIAHVAPRRLFAATAALCLFGGSVAVDVVYRHYITNTYFFGAEYQADAVRMKVIRAHAPDLAGSTLFFITTDPTFFQYTLASGLSFAVYAPGVAVDARYLADPSDICHAKDVRASELVFRVDPADVVEVTPSAMAACR